MQRLEWALIVLLIASSAAMAVAPWWVMDPARPQSATELQFAYSVRTGWGSVLAMMSLAAGALLCMRRWTLGGLWGKLLSVPALILLGLSAFVANSNLLEEIFRPMEAVGYIPAAEVKFLEPDDKLLVAHGDEGDRAYPLRLLQFHHVVNTTAGGTPVAVTWCSVRKAPEIWRAELEPGKPLTFRIAGFANGNLVLEDQQTHSWWAQADGEALLGPLAGREIHPLRWEETTLAQLQAQHPQMEVLQPAEDSVLAPR
ncbi:MAG: DUF3179 domain-containing protein [Acidobacteria bacterium]|nr:DUF3179 domain-containing protein [Acidobacteriota bacterium]